MNKIIDFQRNNQLVPDGIVGPNTAEVLRERLGILNNEHLAHFLGQCSHETGNFSVDEENLRYSKDRLRIIFGKYFPTPASTDGYVMNPQKIANKVYGNRMGNGDEDSGDGWLYRGRGSLQLTGRNNYTAFAKFMNEPEILCNPELVCTKYYFASAIFFFSTNKLWSLCTIVHPTAIKTLTRRINGGYNGLEHRVELTNKYYKMIQ